MAQTKANALVHCLAIALLIIIALLGSAKAVEICGIDSTKLDLCHAAVTGKHPPKPSSKCCALVRHTNLPCLCKYKSFLPAVGINSKNALALPRKCGLRTPPQCRET